MQALNCLWWGRGHFFRALDEETRRLVLDELAARDGQTLFVGTITL
jgi:hypothetical protein